MPGQDVHGPRMHQVRLHYSSTCGVGGRVLRDLLRPSQQHVEPVSSIHVPPVGEDLRHVSGHHSDLRQRQSVGDVRRPSRTTVAFPHAAPDPAWGVPSQHRPHPVSVLVCYRGLTLSAPDTRRTMFGTQPGSAWSLTRSLTPSFLPDIPRCYAAYRPTFPFRPLLLSVSLQHPPPTPVRTTKTCTWEAGRP